MEELWQWLLCIKFKLKEEFVFKNKKIFKKIINQIILCPNCSLNKNSWDIKVSFVKEKNYYNGHLKCKSCSYTVVILKSVLDFTFSNKKHKHQVSKSTTTHYSEYWNLLDTKKFSGGVSKGEILFLEKFYFGITDKIICDVGCGYGRHINEILKLNPKYLICIDKSEGIYSASKNNDNNKNILFLRADINYLPLKLLSVDTIFSVGTLNLLSNQNKIIENFCSISREMILLGLTSNNFYGKLYQGLNFLRPITSRLHRKKGLYFLVFPFAIIIFLYCKLVSYGILPAIIFSQHDCQRLLHHNKPLANIFNLLIEPFVSSKIFRYSNDYYFEKFSINGFKGDFLNSELLVDFLFFLRKKR